VACPFETPWAAKNVSAAADRMPPDAVPPNYVPPHCSPWATESQVVMPCRPTYCLLWTREPKQRVEVDEPKTQRECATHTPSLSTWEWDAYSPRVPHKTKRFGHLDTHPNTISLGYPEGPGGKSAF
jgi:hypothetical protein